jgi:hypothetical protein
MNRIVFKQDNERYGLILRMPVDLFLNLSINVASANLIVYER